MRTAEDTESCIYCDRNRKIPMTALDVTGSRDPVVIIILYLVNKWVPRINHVMMEMGFQLFT